MKIAKYVVLFVYAIVCIILILLATMHRSEKPGASATITGSSSNNFYDKNKGRTKEGKMKRLMIIDGILFVVLSIVLSVLFLVK